MRIESVGRHHIFLTHSSIAIEQFLEMDFGRLFASKATVFQLHVRLGIVQICV